MVAIAVSAILLLSAALVPIDIAFAVQPKSASGIQFDIVNHDTFTESSFDGLARLQAPGLPFVANEGQVHQDVRYYVDTFAGRVFVTEDGLTYSLRNSDGTGVAIKEGFVGSYPLELSAHERSGTQLNFFAGSEINWKTDVPSYYKVSFGQVWQGVDVDLKAASDNVEKIFTMAPGADVEDIKISVDGVTTLGVSDTGELVLETGIGQVKMTKPIAFQNVDGLIKSVNVSYVLGEGHDYGFALGDDYDPNYPVVIDPLIASTFLGGTETEGVSPDTLNPSEGEEIAFDSGGNVYIAGLTMSEDYPTSTTLLSDAGFNSDVVVSKLSADLTQLLASTYIAGENLDEAVDIAIDSSGIVYIAGRTNSTNYPTTFDAYDQTFNGAGLTSGTYDGFVSRLNTTLGLIDSTYLGGVDRDEAFDLAINAAGTVYVAGRTFSTDFPTTPGAYDETFNLAGQSQAFITAFLSDLSGLASSTLAGGSNDSTFTGIAINATGHIFVVGWTLATNFPIIGGYDATKSSTNQHDTVIAIFNPSLSSLERSTFHGAGSVSGHHTTPFGIVLSPSEAKIYIAGLTRSPDFPTTPGAYDTTPNIGFRADAYISVLPNSLDSLLASTVIGSDATNEVARGLAVTDSAIYIVALGGTAITDWPVTPGAYGFGSNDSYITALDLDLTTILASTSFGGSNTDILETVAFNPAGEVVVAGHTRSTTFPTTSGAYDTTKAGVTGAFDFTISKLTPDLAADPSTIEITSIDDLQPKWGEEITISGTATGIETSCVLVKWGDGSEDIAPTDIANGVWGPISHAYPSSALGTNTLSADLYLNPSCVDPLVDTSSQVDIDVQLRDVAFLMRDIGAPAENTQLTVSGVLIDADSSEQLSGRVVTFTGSGAGGLPSVVTGGIILDDPAGILIETCPACLLDNIDFTQVNSEDDPVIRIGENVLVRLHPDGSFTFPEGTQAVTLDIQDTGVEEIVFEVTEFDVAQPFEVSSFGSGQDTTTLTVSAPNGIEQIRLASVSGAGGTVGISKVETSHPENTPQAMITADLENLQDGTYTGPIELEGGSFFARTQAIDVPNPEVQAQYAGVAGLYNPGSSATRVYDVRVSWGAAGDPTSFTVDSGTGINTIKCAIDGDGDGLCNTWEGASGVITYSGTLYQCGVNPDFECSAGDSQVDIYVEMDYYVGHEPLAGAIDDVVAAFTNVPTSDLPGSPGGTGIALHIALGDSLPHAHNLIEVWADPDGASDNVQDDFEDIKANNFGTAGERAGGLLASNNLLKAKAQIFHYGVWVHGIGGTCGASTPSGIAEAPGNDFVVSLGCGFADTDLSHAGSEGDRNEQAGTLMHELGHNLNLDHGGPKEFRQLPNGNSLLGTPAYAVTDAGGNDNSRKFTITGLDVQTNQARDGTVIIPLNTPFSANPGTTTVSSLSWSGQGSNLVINTVTSFVSGTGNSRLVTLVVSFETPTASDASTGDLGTFTVGLNVANTGPTLNMPTTPASGPKLKLDISSTDSSMNCKVNYASVMSYSRQFDTYLGANYVLDYSRSAISPLVDEALSNAEDNFFTTFPAGIKLVSAYNNAGARAYKVNTAPDIDWSGAGGIAGTAIQDSNHFGISGCGATANQKQRGYDDWKNIQLDFKEGIGSFDGNYPDPRAILEITPEMLEEQNIQVDEGTATTTALPASGTYGAPQPVTLTSDEAATIYYTTDGSEPSESSLSGASPVQLMVSSDTTLKFFSISDATGNPEVVRTEVYTFEVLDTTPPVITVIGDIEEDEYFLSGSVPAEPTCTATDDDSGVLEPPGCVVTGYSSADGSHTLTATAEDNAGNVATLEIHYFVGPLTFQGFFHPVDNAPTVNTVKAGKVVPLKFEVFASGTEVTDVLIVDSVKQFKVACDPGDPTDPVEETISSPGGTLLRYDDVAGQFVYNWKAPSTLGCYNVVVTLDDGSTLLAKFRVT